MSDMNALWQEYQASKNAPPVAQPDMNSLWQEYQSQKQAPPAQDMGAGQAALQGFESTLPFAEKASAALAGAVESGINGKSWGENYDQARAIQKATQEAHPYANIAGSVGGIAATLPLTAGGKAGEALSTVNNWVRGSDAAKDAGTLAKAGNLALRAGRSALVAAPVGAVYGAAAADPGKLVEGAESGAKVAALLGAATPLIGAAWNAVAKPDITPDVAKLAQRAKDFGIDLSVDQVAPGAVRDTVQKVSQTLPFSGVDAFRDAQRADWQSALAGTLGQDAANLGPDTIKNFLEDASDKFESIVKHTDIKTDTKSLDALQNIANDARDNITKDYSDIVVNKANNIANQLFTQREVPSGLEYTPKQITGSKLASIRSQLIQSIPKTAGDARSYISDMVDVIDDIAKNNLAGDDIKNLEVARRQWRNFKTIEPLLEKSPTGDINPTDLMQRVASSKYIKASRIPIGQDDLVDLARIGKQFLPVKGGSDTAQKLAYIKGAADIGAAGAGYATGVLPQMAGTLAANRAYQSLYNQSPAMVARVLSGNAPQLSGEMFPLVTGNVASRLSQ